MTPDWLPVAVSAAVPIVLCLVGYGVLKNQVATTRDELAEKADKDVVTVQYEAICTRLERIERKLDASNHR